MPVPDHDGNQILPAIRYNTIIMGRNHHSVNSFGSTGTDKFIIAFDLYDTQPASFAGLFRQGIFYLPTALVNRLGRDSIFRRRQVRVIAKCWDIDVGFSGGL
jgi:hypothetical protein